MREVVALLDAGRLAEIGPLLDASHASLARRLRGVLRGARPGGGVRRAAAGALGARMTGGGFGGSAIALVPRERVDAVTERVGADFAAAGYGEPEIRPAEPSAGAGRW